MWTITALTYTEQRVFGWFENLADAQTAVENNTGSMQENLYKYIVIEEYFPGIHPSVTNEVWYEWIQASVDCGFSIGNWNLIDKPKKYIGITNFALG